MASICAKSCIVYTVFVHRDVMETFVHIQNGVIFCATYLVEYVSDVRDGVVVYYGSFIQLSEVNDNSIPRFARCICLFWYYPYWRVKR